MSSLASVGIENTTVEPSNNSLCKRIIPCLDVDSNGRTVKGVQFQGLRDVGDPVELAVRYQEQGADELVFLDISASHENRDSLIHVIHQVARELMIPFTVGGGIRTLEDVLLMLEAGADKVSVNSAAVKTPDLINQIAEHCGSQCCVLAIDACKRSGLDTVDASEWDVLVQGGRQVTGLEALSWAKEAVQRGAGEILLTSWDRDGTGSGFDIELTRTLSTGVSVPVIASGGAKGPETFVEVFQQGAADAALAASIFHDGHWTVDGLKHVLIEAHIPVRLR